MLVGDIDRAVVEKKDAVRRCHILRGLSKEFVSELVAALDARVFEPGAIIVEEGDKDFFWYVIVNGEADVLIGPQHRQVTTLKTSTIFGEVMDGKHPKRSATVRAVDYCDCRRLTGSSFVRTMKKFPKERDLLTSFQAIGLRCSNDQSGDRPQQSISGLKRLIAEAEPLASSIASPSSPSSPRSARGIGLQQQNLPAKEDSAEELSSSSKSSLLTSRLSLSGSNSTQVSKSPRTPSSASVSPLITGGSMMSARSAMLKEHPPASIQLAQAHSRRPELPGYHELATLLQHTPSMRLAAAA